MQLRVGTFFFVMKYQERTCYKVTILKLQSYKVTIKHNLRINVYYHPSLYQNFTFVLWLFAFLCHVHWTWQNMS